MKILLVKDTKRDISELTNRQAVSILGTWMSTLSLLEDEISSVRMNACTWRDKVQNLNPILDVWKTWVQGKGVAGCNINLLKAWIWHENTISYQWECDTAWFFWKCDFHWKCTSNGWIQGALFGFFTAKTWLYFIPTPNFFLAKGFQRKSLFNTDKTIYFQKWCWITKVWK